MQSRRFAAWRKSRTFGDIYGGRARRRVPDNLFRRAHSLAPPAPGQATPLLVQDNPSRDYFFPVSAEEVAAALALLPGTDVEGITHLWLRRLSHPVRRTDFLPLADSFWGSGVCAVVLYPTRCDLSVRCGSTRPEQGIARALLPYAGPPVRRRGKWQFQLTLLALRRFYLEELLLHEVGHLLDPRHQSAAASRRNESFAQQYAARWRGVVREALEAHSQEARSPTRRSS